MAEPLGAAAFRKPQRVLAASKQGQVCMVLTQHPFVAALWLAGRQSQPRNGQSKRCPNRE